MENLMSYLSAVPSLHSTFIQQNLSTYMTANPQRLQELRFSPATELTRVESVVGAGAVAGGGVGGKADGGPGGKADDRAGGGA